MNRKNWGYILIISGGFVFLLVVYINSRYAGMTRPFSSYALLTSSWERYKNEFINKDGRVIDTSQNITTSEGQSYALLRSVFIDDKANFDLIWNWTETNMKRPKDNLFGWRWGWLGGSRYGFLDNGGDNSAADADSDIALALILAGKRWGDKNYTDAAILVLKDLWDKEIAMANGNRYLIAGNWAASPDTLTINPSYFSPYAWRIFAAADPDHDWNSLIKPAYDLLVQSGKAPLNQNKGVGLPPDWLAVNRKTGEILPPPGNLDTNYSFDAIRIPWKIALDYQWNKDPAAYNYLASSFGYLSDYYAREGKLPTDFTHDGKANAEQENPSMYATAMGYFMIIDPETAQKIYQDKIIRLYSNDDNTFRKDLPYYEQNWLWFCSALYNQDLVPA